MPYRVPWHLQERYQSRSRVPELILEQGRAQAEGWRRSGDIWANALMQASQGVGEAIRQAPHEKEALEVSKSRRAALEEETSTRRQGREAATKRNEAFAQGGTRQAILARLEGDPEGYAAATKHFREIDDNLKRTLGSYAAAVRATGDNPEYAHAAIQDMVENGFDPKQLEPYAKRMMTKGGVTQVLDTLLRGSPDEGHQKLATPKEEPYTLAPGAQRRRGTELIASNPPKAPEPPAVGSFEDYMLAPPERRAEIERGRKGYQQADDRPRVTVNAPSGMSPTMEANVVNRLTKQWDAAVKPVAELSRQVKLMDTGLEAARSGNLAQGSQAVLVTFQKILDPTSVVRESEYMRSAAGQALLTRVKGAFEQLQKGGAGVPLTELEKFADLARQAAKTQSTGYVDAIKERIGKTADRYKIPRELVSEEFDFQGALEPKAATPASTRPAPKVGDVVRGYRFKGGDPADSKSWEKVP